VPREREDSPQGVGVFGSSEPVPGGADYERARRIGELLAAAKIPVVCGGYGGVMEAASRGARDAGGEAIGVTCAAFRGRSPNRYLTRTFEEPDLSSRTRLLIALSRGFIILPGKSGTLAELTFLWALRRAGLLGDKPVAMLGEGWAELLDLLISTGLLEEDARNGTFVVGSEAEAVGVAAGLSAG
jgi:uncharacterized protein (TIGR00730 family)